MLKAAMVVCWGYSQVKSLVKFQIIYHEPHVFTHMEK